MKWNITLSLLSLAAFWLFGTSVLLAQQHAVQKKVDEYIDAYVQMNQFSGAILIAKNDQILHSKGYGFSNYQFNIENTAQTKFQIASLTKGFTTVAIMQLVEQNKLSLDDKLVQFIPDYPRGKEISLKHLLTCTSGIIDHTELEDFDKERRVYPFTPLQTIETFKTLPLEYYPGEEFNYSNSNYILLGIIIEKVSEMAYDEYVKQNIFDPLKMKNSGFEKPEKVIHHLAQGYTFKNNELENAKFRDMSNAHASGALYSTVEDLYKWDQALYSEKLIGEESIKAMFTPFRDNYGFGWGIVDVFKRTMIGHSGEIDGFTSNISRFVDDEVCIIILSNFEHTPMSRINKDLIAIVFGEEYSIPEVINAIQLSDHALQSYVGEYELKPGFTFAITFNDGSLFCQPTGQPKLELFPRSQNEFILKEVDTKVSFERGSNQKIEKLILHQGGKQIPAFKVE